MTDLSATLATASLRTHSDGEPRAIWLRHLSCDPMTFWERPEAERLLLESLGLPADRYRLSGTLCGDSDGVTEEVLLHPIGEDE